MLLTVALAVSSALFLFADVPEPDPTVAALDASFTEQYETAGQPLRDLRAKYLEKVEEWMLQSQKNGDLEAVIAAKEEIKRVHLDRIEVRVDGEERALAMVSSAGVEAPVGIGPAFGSVVTVEMMRVLELKPD